jgi:hypothetical protein
MSEEIKDQNQQEVNLDQFRPYVRAFEGAPIHRIAPKMQRNDICSIESKKFKNCCGKDGHNYCKRLFNQFVEATLKKELEEKKKLEAQEQTQQTPSNIVI